jgi:hypothetical protein
MKTLRKTYEIDGDVFVCKVPDVSDGWAAAGVLPILPNITSDDPEQTAKVANRDPQAMLKMLEWADRLILLCAITPKFIEGSPESIPDGCIPIREVHPFTRIELATALMGDAKFTREAAQRVVPTSATDEGSSLSTQ